MPGISSDAALHAFWTLIPLKTEFETTVQPLGSYHAPFTQWAHNTRLEMQETMDKIQLSKSPAEMLALTEKAKPKFAQALKVAKAIAPIDSNVAFLTNHIQTTSACLAKRQVALQQADSKLKNAIDLAMTGLPVNVSSLDSLVNDAKAVCP